MLFWWWIIECALVVLIFLLQAWDWFRFGCRGGGLLVQGFLDGFKRLLVSWGLTDLVGKLGAVLASFWSFLVCFIRWMLYIIYKRL